MNLEEAQGCIESVYQEKDYFGTKSRESFARNTCACSCDLSLIIPVYNAEKYLEECLKSVVNQLTNYTYEIICINDGSTDSSLQILEKYKENIRIFTQENQGISCARNKGLELSNGLYVGFIDNDDFVNSNYVETLLQTAYKYQADYVKCGHVEMKNGSVLRIVSKHKEVLRPVNNCVLKYDGFIWGGIQHRRLWDGFCFPFGYWYEDMITRPFLYKRSKVWVNIPDMIYIKRIHDTNASLTVWKAVDFQSLDQYFLMKQLVDLVNEFDLKEDSVLYRILLMEFGPMLSIRTSGLPEEIRKAIFVMASELLKKHRVVDGCADMKKIERLSEQSLLNRDYALWNMLFRYWTYCK